MFETNNTLPDIEEFLNQDQHKDLLRLLQPVRLTMANPPLLAA